MTGSERVEVTPEKLLFAKAKPSLLKDRMFRQVPPTFSGEQFKKLKVVDVQILRPYVKSWKVTLLYFVSVYLLISLQSSYYIMNL